MLLSQQWVLTRLHTLSGAQLPAMYDWLVGILSRERKRVSEDETINQIEKTQGT